MSDEPQQPAAEWLAYAQAAARREAAEARGPADLQRQLDALEARQRRRWWQW